MSPTANATPAQSAPSPSPSPAEAPKQQKADFTEFDNAIDSLAEDVHGTEEAQPKAAPPDSEETAHESPAAETPEASSPPDLGEDLAGIVAKKTPKPEAKPPVQNGDDKRGPKALREELARVKGESAKHTARIKELEAAVQKAADDGRKAAAAELQERLERATAERDEYETKVRYLNYAESQEYKDRYVKPLHDTLRAAEEELEGMTVETADGQSRTVTMQDFLQIVNLPAAEARRRATEVFKESAADMMRLRGEVRRHSEAGKAALAEWKEKGSKYQSEQQAEREQATKELNAVAEERVQTLAKAAPDIFGTDVEDPEVKGYLEKSRALVDLAFGRTPFKPGTTPRDAALARAKALGDMEARTRAFPRILAERNDYKAKLEAAEAKLKQYETSEPDTGGARGEKTTNDPLDYAAQIDALAEDLPG